MKLRFLSIFGLFLCCGQLSYGAPFTLKFVDIAFESSADWRPKVRLKKTQISDGTETEIILQLDENKKMTKFSLVETEPFPKLDLSNAPAGKVSRETFYESLKRWVSCLNLTPKEFIFYGTHEGESFSFSKPYPYYTKPVSLSLERLTGRLYLQEKKLKLSQFFVRAQDGQKEGFSSFIEISSKLPSSYLTYDLPFQIEGSGAKNPQIIAVKHDGSPSVYEERAILYTHPFIPGISEFSRPEETKIHRDTPSEDSIIYKDARAAYVFKKDWTEDAVAFISESEDLEKMETETITGTETDSEIEDKTEAPIFRGIETRSLGASYPSPSIKLSDESYSRDESLTLFHLLGEEEVIESPYLYSDGQYNYLTETHRQKCRSETEREGTHILSYTHSLPFKVFIKSNDMRLPDKSVLPKGLYSLRGSLWTEINSMYREKNDGSEYESLPYPEDGFSKAIKEAQRVCSPTMKNLYRYLGNLLGFIQPHPKILEDDGNFKKYYDLIYSPQGLLKTMISIPPEHEHLIVPLLLTAREDPNLNDPELRERRVNSSGYLAVFNYSTGYLAVSDWHYLRCLPLIKGKELYLSNSNSIRANYTGDGFFPSSVDKISEMRSKESGGPSLSQKDYYEIARFIKLNQLKRLSITHFSPPSMNDVLTIQPFADAIREQTSIDYFHIEESYINMKNITYLLLNGISENASIKKFKWVSSLGNGGDYIVSVIGGMLSKNKSITGIECEFFFPNDLEAFNALGRGLQKNTSLKHLHIRFTKIDVYADPYPARDIGEIIPNVYIYSPHLFTLPGRPLGTTTEDLSEFVKGVQESALVGLNFDFRPLCFDVKGRRIMFSKMSQMLGTLKKIKKPGLRIHVYHPEGSEGSNGSNWEA